MKNPEAAASNWMTCSLVLLLSALKKPSCTASS